MESKQVTISGAGLVGSLLSIYLAQKGHRIRIFERRLDPRKTLIDGGRSINLALSDRGWKALEGVGLEGEIRKMAIPMYRRVMHAVDGSLSFQPYGKEGQAIYSVSRAGLNAKLMDLAEKTGKVNIIFDQRCLDVDLHAAEAVFENQSSGERNYVKADLLFGADGAFSMVRGAMQKTDRFNYSQHYIEHAYKELTIPPGEDGKHLIEKEALHIWPRGNYMLIALPNLDGSFTCTLFFPHEGKPSFESIDTTEKARDFFSKVFPDALALMPDFDVDWEQNPISSLVIIRCFPWTSNNKVALIGDASHAIVPFYGQGMNCGFEDCTVLNQLMEKYGDDWYTIFGEFEKERKPNADAIADLAMRNFIEMRDLTGDEDFLFRKKIEGWFSAKHPDKWLPLYSMVTFSHIPYSEALAEGVRQDRIMDEIMKMPDINTNWQSVAVEEKILSLL